ncbi:unnamed protein product [Didymodactylos carnosus]|uniref:Uncharacterized protein n=1 Tax=Didymodactylos carnosus TaxID=1234261 RepID=A0A813RS52_9BILA|nr:unnamed protein product [Didymodactylos carnosus]CAF0785193.1 unnamed protein product [Didymodactylos carnosus]CAF3531087.1 unnamed protein product [Didymodactylos carnosus]CAF3568859.1 unnamed protein product [Didymodactylos carnosus]
MSPTPVKKVNSQRRRQGKKSTIKRNCNKRKMMTNTTIALHIHQQQRETPCAVKNTNRISNKRKNDDMVYIELDTKCGCGNTCNSNIQFTKRYLECKKTMQIRVIKTYIHMILHHSTNSIINIYNVSSTKDNNNVEILLNDNDELKNLSYGTQTSHQLPHIQLKFTIINLSTLFANCLCIQDNKNEFYNSSTISFQDKKHFSPTIIESAKLSSILSTYSMSSISPIVSITNIIKSPSPSILIENKSSSLVSIVQSSSLEIHSSSEKRLPSILTPPLSPTPSSTNNLSIVPSQCSSLNILTPPNDRESSKEIPQHSGFIIKDIEDFEDDHQWDVINEVARRFGEPIHIDHYNSSFEKNHLKHKKTKKSKQLKTSATLKRMLPKLLPKLPSNYSSSSSLSSLALPSPILSSSLSNSSFDDSCCPVDLSIKKRLFDENSNTTTKYIKI